MPKEDPIASFLNIIGTLTEEKLQRLKNIHYSFEQLLAHQKLIPKLAKRAQAHLSGELFSSLDKVVLLVAKINVGIHNPFNKMVEHAAVFQRKLVESERLSGLLKRRLEDRHDKVRKHALVLPQGLVREKAELITRDLFRAVQVKAHLGKVNKELFSLMRGYAVLVERKRSVLEEELAALETYKHLHPGMGREVQRQLDVLLRSVRMLKELNLEKDKIFMAVRDRINKKKVLESAIRKLAVASHLKRAKLISVRDLKKDLGAFSTFVEKNVYLERLAPLKAYFERGAVAYFNAEKKKAYLTLKGNVSSNRTSQLVVS
ncbi:MAG TPA: hypothetical protein VFE88_01780 [Candidatus Nanoarchaeia archaeon]|nr:hypothetical protein [Candidatus Nanoarchaeia archaeon]